MPHCAVASVRCMGMYYSLSDSSTNTAVPLVALFGLHETIPLKEKAIEKREKNAAMEGELQGGEGG